MCVRIRVAKPDNYMAQPSRILEAAKPHEALPTLQKQHAAPYEDIVRRSDQDKRPAAQLESGGLNIGGVTEQDRAAAGTGLGKRHECEEEVWRTGKHPSREATHA